MTPVMRYLACGLRLETRRFALTDVADATKWRALGVEVPTYEPIDGSHDAAPKTTRLGSLLSRWSPAGHNLPGSWQDLTR